MYKISEIASFFEITVKTLYLYEKNGLLPPAWVDPHTGYRWYDNNSILRLSLILQFKDCGMTLREIRSHLSGKLSIQKQLDRMYFLKENIERSIALLSGWAVTEGVYTVEQGHFEARCCLSHTLTARDTEEIFAMHDTLLSEAVHRGISIDRRYCSFCRFHGGELRMTNIPVTVYLNIHPGNAPGDAINIPGTEVIFTRHKGAYESIRTAYECLWEYAYNNDLIITGDPIESYIKSYESGEESDFITEVLLPAQKLCSDL